jgi:hypothetical protein
MTGYFSVQIEELNHYTSNDYWYSFAVIMVISILGMFFFSRLLMYITEKLDQWMKQASKAFASLIFRKRVRHVERVGDIHDRRQ